MKNLALGAIMLFFSNAAFSAVTCSGTVDRVYTWHNFTHLSMVIKTESGALTNWVNLRKTSEESLALMAFATQKPITLHMSSENITSCTAGWNHNTKLEGYFQILNQ